jgi:hypothetical protein
METVGLMQKISITESKMHENIRDCKFYVEKYTESHKSHEVEFTKMTEEI